MARVCSALRERLVQRRPVPHKHMDSAGAIDCLVHTLHAHRTSSEIAFEAIYSLVDLLQPPCMTDKVLSPAPLKLLVDATMALLHAGKLAAAGSAFGLFSIVARRAHAEGGRGLSELAYAGCGAAAAQVAVSLALSEGDRFVHPMFTFVISSCTVLHFMSAEPAAHGRLLEGNVPASMCRVLARYRSHHECGLFLAIVACVIWRNIGSIAAHRPALMAAGIAPFVIWTLQSHGRHEVEAQAAWPACGALFALACEPAHCATLLQLGAATHAAAALSQHKTDARIAWAACGIMVKLAAVEELLEPLQQRDGAGTALVLALRTHGTDRRVVRAACGALRRLASLPSNRPLLLAQGAAAAVGELLAASPADEEIVAALQAAAAALGAA